MLLQALLQPVHRLRGQGLSLGQVHEAAEVSRVLNDLFHTHVIRCAGTQHDAVGHIPGPQGFAAQGAVDDRLGGAQIKEHPRHLPKLCRDGRPGQLHIAVAAGAHDDHLAQRGRDTCGHQNLFCHIAQPQHILGRGDQCTLTDKDTRFFRAGDHIGGLAVPPDGGQPQRAPQMARRQQPVEHGGLARVLAHTHDGHGLCFVEPPDQLVVHGVHALSLVFSQFLIIAYRGGKRKGRNGFYPFLPDLSYSTVTLFARLRGLSMSQPRSSAV